MIEKSESSSGSSSSYTAESLANEVTKRICQFPKEWNEEDRETFMYREIRDAIKRVAKDTLISERENQRIFRMGMYTDLNRILKRFEVGE